MKKVLLLQDVIPHYRYPVFNELAKKYDFTVAYSKGKKPEGVDFKTMFIPKVKAHYGFYKRNIFRITKDYDAVICMLSYGNMDCNLLSLFPRKCKVIMWGIGVSAGYNCRYDESQKISNILRFLIKKIDAVVFYSDYPKNKYTHMGINPQKMFVANNTVEVCDIKDIKRDIILFVGSLYKQKKIDVLLDFYLEAYKTNKNIPELVIVGDGDETENIKKFTKDNLIEDKITLTGGIYDEKELSKYFEKAIMCISPDQAGLTVLKSMGYGVPFVTHKDAITGGEIFNIVHGENGILLEDFKEIKDIILESTEQYEKYETMGKNARAFYAENRTVDKMVEGFVQAIEYATR